MGITFVTDEKIAETSSKGNQEKWYDSASDMWYKVDRLGYEALSETVISRLLEKSNIKKDTPFTFVSYGMEKVFVHNRKRNACKSKNFLEKGQSIITVSHILKKYNPENLMDKLRNFPSDKKRIMYVAQTVKEITGLEFFPQYLTLLFETDALFVNDDRHLNNIAVIEENDRFSYCPIFDNGAGLLSDVMDLPMDVEPQGLLKALTARPFNTTFNRQKNTAQVLYGAQLKISDFSQKDILCELSDLLEFYPERDRGIITDRVVQSILIRQKNK